MDRLKGVWSGTFEPASHDESCAVTLTVAVVSGDQFEGAMDWPDFGATQTKARGMLKDEWLVWTETQYLRGEEAVLGGVYVAHFAGGDELSGEWREPAGTPGGTFVLKRR